MGSFVRRRADGAFEVGRRCGCHPVRWRSSLIGEWHALIHGDLRFALRFHDREPSHTIAGERNENAKRVNTFWTPGSRLPRRGVGAAGCANPTVSHAQDPGAFDLPRPRAGTARARQARGPALAAGPGRFWPRQPAYRACQGIFERELCLEPDAQTRALVERLLEPGPRPTQTIPPGSRAPPTVPGGVRLVGRAEVLWRMETAWRAGQHIFVAGEPGAGKTSLIFEFADGKGAFLAHHGRPGDRAVPFSALTR